jgi:hypothetical protein
MADPPAYPVSDHGPGLTITYFTKGRNEAELRELLIHENGHGYAKLDDEYWYYGTGAAPQYEIDNHTNKNRYGWYKNTDTTGDPEEVQWAKFLVDERFNGQGLGVFVGGGGWYETGFWRPTDWSIMRESFGGFNAPSREAIYYRTHKLTYGLDWEYDYEEFVAWDRAHPYMAPGKQAAGERSAARIPHTRPQMLNEPASEALRRWRSDKK